jgi:hypothetical protein
MMAHDARLDHHAARWRAERQGKRRLPASAEAGAMGAAGAAPKSSAGVTGLLGGPHDLADEALRFARTTPAVAYATGSDAQFIVAAPHCRGRSAKRRRWRSKR